eukprot:357545-Chlamydomonas_euryale.AAC.1
MRSSRRSCSTGAAGPPPPRSPSPPPPQAGCAGAAVQQVARFGPHIVAHTKPPNRAPTPSIPSEDLCSARHWMAQSLALGPWP